ncbi:MAG: cation-efflux pump [Thermoleophilia bacterium]|nr:cation-efflux pump [Thermoleophilia bacterium]
MSQMSPERRTALASVVAACVLIAIKLVSGIAAGSLAFLAEAAHSGTDLVAALLTFFAVGYARKPADASHLYGHLKAEHLTALAEATFLALVSLLVGGLAVARLTGAIGTEVDAAWWAFCAAGVVLVTDAGRTLVSLRTARRYGSAALLSNALHFGSDLVGTVAVLGGLVAARAGWPAGDSVAALFVAALVVAAAVRLARRNVDVLMDRAPADDVAAARAAISGLEPRVELRRLRLRRAAGRPFVDVVIAVSPGAAVGQGHAAADRVEGALARALPGADVVVHVEPGAAAGSLDERVRAAATSVPRVRDIHNLGVIEMDEEGVEVSLHLKLPADLTLADAHAVAEDVERAILQTVPEVVGVQTHLEPLKGPAEAHEVSAGDDALLALVRNVVAREPEELRLLHTDEGLVVFLTLGVESRATLADAHLTASDVEARIRASVPGVADVIVHTEPSE